MSICLRTLPAHIADETAYRKTEDIDDKSDVNAETYDFLEERFCIIQGKGWPEFREIVRAQAIHMIKETIDAGLFSWKDMRNLHYKLLLDEEFDVEMEIAKHALFSGGLSTAAGTIALNSIVFPKFPREWSDIHLSVFFASNPSALSSLRTRAVWKYVKETPQHICDDAWQSQVASDLAETVLTCLSGINPRTLHTKAPLPRIPRTECLSFLRYLALESPQTDIGLEFGEIVIDLASALIGSLEVRTKCSPESGIYRFRPIRLASSYVIRSCQNARWLNEALKTGLTGSASAVLMADTIVLILGLDDTSSTDQEDLIRTRISWITRLSIRIPKNFQPAHLDIESVESLIIAVSSRFPNHSNGGFARILHVIEFLKNFASCIPEEEGLTSRLAMDAIIRISTQSDDRGVSQQAERIEDEIMRRGTLTMESSPSVRRGSNKKDLRWDTGLCEWMQVTPAIPRVNRFTRSSDDRNSISRDTHNSDSELVVPLPQQSLANSAQKVQEPLDDNNSPWKQALNWRLPPSCEDSIQNDGSLQRRSKRGKIEQADDREWLHKEDFMGDPKSSDVTDEESSLSLQDTEAEDTDTDELSLTTPRALRDITNSKGIRLGNNEHNNKASG